jgi:hypothetical protein
LTSDASTLGADDAWSATFVTVNALLCGAAPDVSPLELAAAGGALRSLPANSEVFGAKNV